MAVQRAVQCSKCQKFESGPSFRPPTKPARATIQARPTGATEPLTASRFLTSAGQARVKPLCGPASGGAVWLCLT